MTDATMSLLTGDEEVILSGLSNKIAFLGGPGGQLVLTNNRLCLHEKEEDEGQMGMPPERSSVRWSREQRDHLDGGAGHHPAHTQRHKGHAQDRPIPTLRRQRSDPMDRPDQ